MCIRDSIKKDEINPAAYTFLDWAISDSAMAMYKENYPIITTNDCLLYTSRCV